MKLTRNVFSYKKKFLSGHLSNDIERFKNIFSNDETIIYRYLSNQKHNNLKACLLFSGSMVDNQLMLDSIIKPFVTNQSLDIEEDNDKHSVIDQLASQVILANDVKKSTSVHALTKNILSGNSVLLFEGSKVALVMNTQGWETRNIAEPESEKTLRGPKEGFTEALMTNVSMIKRKLQTPDLMFEFRELGTQSKTKIALCYVDGLVNEKILAELHTRLNNITIDGIFDTGYIQEMIKDAPLTPYKTVGTTERPDVVAAKILEGRIAILADGTPMALTVPQLFIEYFQSPDDYYKSFYFGSFNRLLRITAYMISFCLPAIYIAFVTYHQEMLPTQLLLSIFTARQAIPFPAILEILLLLFAFELLRESGTRMPTYIGATMSIFGALVLGQAAVAARLVSAPLVIVVAISGISGLMLPTLTFSIVLLRVAFLGLAAFYGLYGFIFGVSGLLIYLFSLRSFGVPYMANQNLMGLENLKDTAVRVPWWYMDNRPKSIEKKDRQRQTSGGDSIG